MDWNDFSQTDIEVIVPPQILERGLNYFHQGQLIKACRLGDMIAGVLIGTGGKYKARLWLKDSGLQGDCTCPYEGFCKHMVALAAGWLETRSLFVDLQPQVNQVLTEQMKLPEITLNLIQKDPVNFLDLFSSNPSQPEFITTKGLLNLIRNSFSFPRLTHNEIELLWEQTIRLQGLIIKALVENESEAPLLVVELFNSLTLVLADDENQVLSKVFLDLICEVCQVIKGKTLEYNRPILDNLLDLYLNPTLFEFSTAIRSRIVSLTENLPEIEPEIIQPKSKMELNLVQLMLFYELYAEFIKDQPQFRPQFDKIDAILTSDPLGRLWLIDRYLDKNVQKAFKLAKEGLWLFPDDKRSYRERLIGIHIRRNELRQAASLSFIQFQSEPNLDEYRRLKEILTNHPADWQSYDKKIKELLIHRDEKLLAIQIGLVEEDWVNIKERFEQIMTDESLLLAAVKLLGPEFPPDLSEYYPVLIRELLRREADWVPIIELLAVYKKYCYQQNQREAWDRFREELNQTYGGEQRFLKKVGSLLIS